jgi:hypothetical protein
MLGFLFDHIDHKNDHVLILLGCFLFSSVVYNIEEIRVI